MGRRVEQILLDLGVTQGSKKVQKVFEDLSRALVEARAETARLGKAAKQVDVELGKGARVTEEWTKTILEHELAKQKQIAIEKQLRKAIADTADEEKRATQIERDRAKQQFETADLAGDVESRTRAITGAIGFVGGETGAGLERSINIGAEALASFEGINKLRRELPQLAANLGTSTMALGALGVAIGVAAVSFEVMKKIIKDSGNATRAFVEVNQKFAEIIALKTTPEVEASIKAIEERSRVLEIERVKLKQFVDEAKNIDGVTGALIDLNDMLGMNLGGYEDVKNRLREVNTELENNEAIISEVNYALQTGTTAAGDYAAQLEKIEAHLRATAAAVITDIDKQANARAQARIRALDPGDPEALQRELEGLHIQYQESTKQVAELAELYRIGLLTEKEYDAEVRRVNLEQQDMIVSMAALKNELIPAAEAAKAEADASAALKKYLDDLTKQREAEALAAQKQIEATIKAADAFERAGVEIEEKRQIAITQEAEDYALKQTRDLAKHYRDLAKLDRDFNDKREDILAKIAEDLSDVEAARINELRDYNRESKRLAEDHAQRILDIERSSKRDIQKAALRLDAIGIYEAQKQAEEALKDEDDQYNLEKRRREEDFQERLRELEDERLEKLRAGQIALIDLQEQHNRERIERIAEYDRVRADEAVDRALKLQRQREAWAREDAARLEAYNRQVGLTAQKMNEITTVVAFGLETVKTQFQNAFNALTTLGSGGPSNVGGFLSGVGGAIGAFFNGLPQFQAGGMVERTGPAWLHQGEMVINPRRAGGGGMGGVTINAPITIGDAGHYSEGQVSDMVTTGILRALQEIAS